MVRAFRSVVGFDDSPFARFHRGDIQIIGTVYTGRRLDGIISGHIRRDGANATDRLALLIQDSKFALQIKLVMLQGIALGGFNVVDIQGLQRRLKIPVLVIARRAPDLTAIKAALLSKGNWWSAQVEVDRASRTDGTSCGSICAARWSDAEGGY